MSDRQERLRRALRGPGDRRLRPLVRLAVAVLAFVALGEVVLAGAAAAARLGSGLAPLARAGWVFGVAAVAVVVANAGVLVVVRLVDGRGPGAIGLALSGRWWTELAAGLGVGAAMALGTVAVALASGVAEVAGVLTAGEGQFSVTAPYPAVDAAFWLVVFAGVGLLEEVVVRGYVLVTVAEGLRGRAGSPRRAVWAGVGASAAVFGALHAASPGGSPLAVANALALGVLLGVTVAVTGRLALAVGIHVGWTAALGLGAGLPVTGLRTGVALVDVEVDGSALVTGGAFGPEGGLLAVIGLAVGVVAVVAVDRRRSAGLALAERLASPDRRRGELVED